MSIFEVIKFWYKKVCNVPFIDLFLMTLVAMLVSVSLFKGKTIFGIIMYLALTIAMYSIYIKDTKVIESDKRKK